MLMKIWKKEENLKDYKFVDKTFEARLTIADLEKHQI